MALATASQQSSQQKMHFDRDGYLVVRGMFMPAEIDEIRRSFMEQAKDGPVPNLSETVRANAPAYDRNDPLARYPRMLHPHSHPEYPVGALAMRYMLDRRIHDVLEVLFREAPLAVQSMFYFKPPGARGQDLHQDNFYLRIKPGTCCAAWLAIDDADEHNGGMIVVPGSSGLEIACPEKSDTAKFFTDHHVPVPPGLSEQPLTLKAGDVLFFNGSVIHGSYPNTSVDRFRRSLIFHYVPQSTAEMARFYKAYRFDGSRVAVPEANGGGPCGDYTPTMAH